MARHPSRGMMGSSAQRKGISRQQCGCENAAGTRIEQSSRQDPSVGLRLHRPFSSNTAWMAGQGESRSGGCGCGCSIRAKKVTSPKKDMIWRTTTATPGQDPRHQPPPAQHKQRKDKLLSEELNRGSLNSLLVLENGPDSSPSHVLFGLHRPAINQSSWYVRYLTSRSPTSKRHRHRHRQPASGGVFVPTG